MTNIFNDIYLQGDQPESLSNQGMAFLDADT